LDVLWGNIFGFIGPNGSGKTTTLRMILRIYQPDKGQVNVLGSLHGSGLDDRVGYLPEERGLYRRMTAGGPVVNAIDDDGYLCRWQNEPRQPAANRLGYNR